VILAALICAAFPDVVLEGRSFFYRDFGLWAYPNACYHRANFWNGEIPLWNPFNNCGLPFLAQWNTLSLYPFSLIHLLLPLPWSLSLFCLFHLWLAGMGMYLLAAKWVNDRFAACVAGLAYALNGLMLHSLMWPNNIAALAWMPLVVLFVWRAWREGGRRIAEAALIGAIQMLAGAPEIIVLTWLLLGAVQLNEWVQGRGTRLALGLRFGVIVALVGLLCAVQLLPFFDLFFRSQRTTGFGTSVWSMPAWGWVNYLVPLFHQSKSVVGVYSQTDQQWTSSYYSGIGVTALALLAVGLARTRRVGLLAAVGFCAGWMAMGENGYLYSGLKGLIPQLGFARFPIKFVVLPTFIIPLLAAWAVRRLGAGGLSRAAKQGAIFLWSAMILTIVGILWAAYRHPAADEHWRVTFESGASRALLLTLTLGAMLSFARLNPLKQSATRFALLLLIAVDALTHAPRQNPTITAGALRPITEFAVMPRLGAARAMVSPRVQTYMDSAATPNLLQYYLGQRRTLFADCNLIDRIPKVNGFYSLYLREETEVQRLLYSHTNAFATGLADFLGVAQISSDEKMFVWVARPTASPLITAGQRAVFSDQRATIVALADPEFEGRKVVYLPLEAGATAGLTNATAASVHIASYSLHRIEATVEVEQPSWLVVAQAFHPGWEGFVNDRPARLWPANHAFQALELPAGNNRVRLAYRDSRFEWGAAISALSFVLSLMVWWKKKIFRA
jgi:hypothetical protein